MKKIFIIIVFVMSIMALSACFIDGGSSSIESTNPTSVSSEKGEALGNDKFAE